MSVSIEQLDETIAEAERFLKKAKDAKTGIEGYIKRRSESDTWYGHVYPSKEIAAVKRSSMDLTRSLADLRR